MLPELGAAAECKRTRTLSPLRPPGKGLSLQLTLMARLGHRSAWQQVQG